MITCEYESFFLSLILYPGGNLVWFDAEGPVPPVQENINGRKVAFSALIILCSYFSFLMDS